MRRYVNLLCIRYTKENLSKASKKITKRGIPMEKYFEEAHRFCSRNRKLLEKDIICGCFHCLKVFNPKEITDWWEKEEDTAECPHCGIDSVIGKSSGFPITKKFLVEMNKRYF